MFDIKCINCKNFNPLDGCEKNLTDDDCDAFLEKVDKSTCGQAESCENCVWQSNGFCDFDFASPKDCRRFKSKLCED